MANNMQSHGSSLWHISQIRAAVFLILVISALSSNARAAPAFPGAEGYGTETTHGRGGIVVRVTNTNDSGSGSLRAALDLQVPRIIIFSVSGTITLQSPLRVGAANSYVWVAGETAPGDGIALRGPASDMILRVSNLNSADKPGVFHDGLFTNLRFRHGSPQPGDISVHDNINLFSGTYNVVFDHNSFTWANDENLSVWGSGQHDITFSRNLFAHGVVLCRVNNGIGGQNVGPLLSGGNPQYRITLHHNVTMHMCFRNFLMDSGSGANPGYQMVNNVHYNSGSQNHNWSQNQYTGTTANKGDVIADYFKNGPDSALWTWPFMVNRSGPGTFQPISVYLVGSTWRKIDGSAHIGNNESDNFKMLTVQADYGFGTATWQARTTPLSPQPVNRVTATSAAQAYIDLIIDRDVGAQPLDTLDRKFIADPEIGGRWSSANIPPPHGSAAYPTLSTYGARADSDSDGVPDSFETTPLGTNPTVFDEQGKLDHDGDGYTNIEEYIHSLSGIGSIVPVEDRPNPPADLTVN